MQCCCGWYVLVLMYVACAAMQMHKLRCFMYVSTAYSNSHVKKYSLVKEQLYPLKDAEGNVADHKAIVQRLLGMPDDEAMQEVTSPPVA